MIPNKSNKKTECFQHQQNLKILYVKLDFEQCKSYWKVQSSKHFSDFIPTYACATYKVLLFSIAKLCGMSTSTFTCVIVICRIHVTTYVPHIIIVIPFTNDVEVIQQHFAQLKTSKCNANIVNKSAKGRPNTILRMIFFSANAIRNHLTLDRKKLKRTSESHKSNMPSSTSS